MSNKVNIFKDVDGYTYPHPERSCQRCLKMPCLENMERLKCDFAKYGCVDFDDKDVYRVGK